jgi:hypothetical protein
VEGAVYESGVVGKVCLSVFFPSCTKKKNRQGITSNSSGFQRISFCYLDVYYIFIDDARKCTIPIDKKNKFI